MRRKAIPKTARKQFHIVGMYERSRTFSKFSGRYILDGEYIVQQRVQWMLFYDAA